MADNDKDVIPKVAGENDDKPINNPNDDKNKNKTNDADKNNGGGDKMIPKTRFDEVNDKLKVLESEKLEREKKDKEADDKKLADDKKFEELATKRGEELEKANDTVRSIRIQSAVERIAAKQGAVDTEAVYALIDKSKIKVDKDGTVEVDSVEEAVKSLLEAKPFLKGSGGSPANIGGGANPDQANSAKKPMSWVKEKWADPKWVRDKHEDLDGKTGEEYLRDLEAKGLIDLNS
jgi:hypothetical protein